WQQPRFLAVIVTWFHSTGGLPRQCAHWLAMTASIRQTTIYRLDGWIVFVASGVGMWYDEENAKGRLRNEQSGRIVQGYLPGHS
ncbi:MAG: hypothetical protein SPE19_01795, partial [Candidatus Faecousia sp.]|nr:hypothetical protein [Candidatus Faecousia sp.]